MAARREWGKPLGDGSGKRCLRKRTRELPTVPFDYTPDQWSEIKKTLLRIPNHERNEWLRPAPDAIVAACERLRTAANFYLDEEHGKERRELERWRNIEDRASALITELTELLRRDEHDDVSFFRERCLDAAKTFRSILITPHVHRES